MQRGLSRGGIVAGDGGGLTCKDGGDARARAGATDADADGNRAGAGAGNVAETGAPDSTVLSPDRTGRADGAGGDVSARGRCGVPVLAGAAHHAVAARSRLAGRAHLRGLV